jgi:hypothetical protein
MTLMHRRDPASLVREGSRMIRAFALSVIAENRQRSSITADNSPSLIKDGADCIDIGLGDEEHPKARRLAAPLASMCRLISR